MSDHRQANMPDDSFRDDSDFDQLDDLQRLIRRAGDYVTVTDDLRPRVLENARERYQERRSAGTLAIVLVLLLTLGMGIRTASLRWKASSASLPEQVWVDDQQRKALVDHDTLAAADETPAWSLAKVFAELRNRRARLLGVAL